MSIEDVPKGLVWQGNKKKKWLKDEKENAEKQR